MALPRRQVLASTLSKYKRIHSYPVGTYLFHNATSATASAPMGPTRSPIDVYMAYRSVEERQATPWNNAGRSARLKALLSESQGKEYTPKTTTTKSHQPRPLIENNTLRLLKIMIY
jgi:hypothetical protein